jgi:hypothetical protein
MNSAMFDVRRSQELILSHGGWHEWQERSRKDYGAAMVWAKTTRGANRKTGRKGLIDINGHDCSYRFAKTRLHNLAIELEELSVLEQAWEIEQPAEVIKGTNSPKMMRLQYSASNAIALYNGAVKQDTFSKLQNNCAEFMRKRGRDWEVSTSPDYPQSDSEDEDIAYQIFKTNRAQREFIDKSEVPAVESVDNDQDAPSKRKRRRTDVTLSFNSDIYVRSEANVDNLRRAASNLDEDALEDNLIAAIPVPGASILRTTSLEVDPRPKRRYRRRELKKHDGPIRPWYRWDRRGHLGHLYRRGSWAVSEGCVNVDTSGHTFRKDEEGWKKYNETLQFEAEEMDMECEMKRDFEEETSSDVESDDVDETPLYSSSHQAIKQSIPSCSYTSSDSEKSLIPLPGVQQLPEKRTVSSPEATPEATPEAVSAD